MTDPVVIAVKLLGRSDDVQPEPFCINQGISWRDLRAMIMAFYEDFPEELDIRYEDDEGDMCILSSDDELQEAFRFSQVTANVLQLNVRSMDQTFDLEPEVNVIHVDPHSLFTDAVKEGSICRCDCEAKCTDDRSDRSGSELAETGESAPKHVFDEETGLMHTNTEPKAVSIDRTEEQLLEVVSHEPVVRKKACYYELQGCDIPPEVVPPITVEGFHPTIAEVFGPVTEQRLDRDSGEHSSRTTSTDGETMPYQAFVHFMEKLKLELKNEIVHDVTKKTAKQVLKGLDTAWPFNAGSRKEGRNFHPLYLHEKILCDRCQKTIIGPRYKCGNCPDFDLCEECEAKPGTHDIDHVFIKLRRPCLEAGVKDGKKVPLLKHVLYARTEKLTDEQEKLRHKKWSEKMDRRLERLRKREEKVQEKQKKKEEKLKRKWEKLDSSSVNRNPPQKREKVEAKGFMLPQFKYPYQVLGAEFVRDITIPDFTCVQPGTRMQKTWKVKNTGSHQWSDSTMLRLMWGTITSPKTEVPVPALSPDQEGDITVELIAPEEPGKYQSHWKLFDRGVNFGHRVWCSIVVEPREVLEPTKEDQLKMVASTDGQTHGAEDEEEEEEIYEEPQAEDPKEEIFLEAVEEKPAPAVIMASKLVQEKPAPAVIMASKLVQEKPAPAVIMASKLVPATLIPVKSEPADITEVKATVGTQVETTELEEGDLLPKCENSAVEGVADLLSFEFLELGDRKTSKASQTATPNNTPLDVSPPKSPAPERVIPNTVSNSSSVEVVGEGEADLPHLTEYVTQHMASLELKPDTFDEADIESLSSLSSDDDSDDYCIVPLPDCFNPYMPLTHSALDQLEQNSQDTPTTQDETVSEESGETKQPSLDEMLTTSKIVATPALDPEPASDNVTQVRPLESEQGRQLQVQAIETIRVVDENQNSEEDREQTVPIQSTPSEFVNQLFHTAISAAAKASVKAYSTTKDVISSMQAKQWKQTDGEHDDLPHDEECTPPKQWTPPANTYVPPKQEWTPPEDNYVPPQSKWTGQKKKEERPATSDPMKRLLEMGFANRELNSQLLKRHNDDLEPVIQELLSMLDENWAGSRHGNQ